MRDSTPHLWWQRGIIYQVYPRSFMDTNGDGVGDLPGIVRKLDYLRDLGVDALWLSPTFPSPMADFGYDVSDYTGVHPQFGTLDDMDRLIDVAHARGLKIMLDLVPNHTSDEHPWFVESRSSRDNPRRDWYLWRDPAPDGGPPNNWLSVFGGSAWTLDPATGQYYCHSFLAKQPDLNYRNPAVLDAMLAVLRFWLDRGIDGFRVDVIHRMLKDELFRDNPANPHYIEGTNPYHTFLSTHVLDLPEVHGIIRRMREVLDEYDERMMVGEIYLPIERLMRYYGDDGSGLHMPYNFQLIEVPWDASTIAATIDTYERALPAGGWPNWVLGNHDRSRIASRVGPAQARVAAMLLLTLRGTPTIYYGDEIGMRDVPIPPERVQDPVERNVPGLALGRDPERTPMQWDASAHAGFTAGTPWLPVAADYQEVNVAVQDRDERSMLALHKRLIALRASEPALAVGAYVAVPTRAPLVAFQRAFEDRRFLVVLNLSAHDQSFEDVARNFRGKVVLSTHLDRAGEEVLQVLTLRPDEGLIVSLPGS